MKKIVLLFYILLSASQSNAIKVGKVIMVPDGSECVKLTTGRYICEIITTSGQKNCFYRDGTVKSEADCQDFEEAAKPNE